MVGFLICYEKIIKESGKKMGNYVQACENMYKTLLKGEKLTVEEFWMKYKDVDKGFWLKEIENHGIKVDIACIDEFCADVKRTIRAREDVVKCQKFAEEYECRYNDFLNLLYTKSKIDPICTWNT